VVARRGVAFFGQASDQSAVGPLPQCLLPLRASASHWPEPEAFAVAVINEYHPDTPIGWHRDARQYGIVAGCSAPPSHGTRIARRALEATWQTQR
jgi:hypothetical protein